MTNQIPPTVHIIANGLPDAYYQAINICLKNGAIVWRDYNGPMLTKSIVSLIEIKNPYNDSVVQMLHPDFPTKELHLKEYIKQFERDYNWKAQGFEYSYVDRLINYPTTEISSRADSYFKVAGRPIAKSIDQVKALRGKVADIIKQGGDCLVSNRYQAITWVPERDLFVREDQPCLQRIQIFIYSLPVLEGDKVISQGKGEFHVDWRSRDLYAAWNSNMVALTLFLKREIFDPNHIKIIRAIDFCSSLHIYQGDWESASKIKSILKSPQMMMCV